MRLLKQSEPPQATDRASGIFVTGDAPVSGRRPDAERGRLRVFCVDSSQLGPRLGNEILRWAALEVAYVPAVLVVDCSSVSTFEPAGLRCLSRLETFWTPTCQVVLTALCPALERAVRNLVLHDTIHVFDSRDIAELCLGRGP